ncbi:MAG: hypothetical protein NFCOHLIN_03118 [Gammaproteobacteria bacterium]|nr:hypothetical protein [Gammaproteobacteria bacterium]
MMKDATNIADVTNAYRNAVELGLRASKVLQAGAERSVREHLAYLEAAGSQFTGVNFSRQPQDLVAAQTASLEKAREQFAASAKNLLNIQQETAAELRALVTEGVEKFVPANLANLFKAA